MKLSVIILVYNVEQYVRQCVESVYRQGLDEHDFEVIIVNDGTQDGSIERMQGLRSEHSNIRVVLLPRIHLRYQLRPPEGHYGDGGGHRHPETAGARPAAVERTEAAHYNIYVRA